MQLFSARHLVRLNFARDSIPEGSLGQRFHVDNAPGTLAEVREDGRWSLKALPRGVFSGFLELVEPESLDLLNLPRNRVKAVCSPWISFSIAGSTCLLPQATLQAGTEATQNSASDQRTSRMKHVRQAIHGPSAYALQDLPISLQTATFETCLANQLLPQPSHSDIVLDADIPLQIADEPHGSSLQCSDQQQAKPADMQQQRQQTGLQIAQGLGLPKPDVAQQAALYVQRFHGFADGGRSLITAMTYGIGDVLQAARVVEWNEVMLSVNHLHRLPLGVATFSHARH